MKINRTVKWCCIFSSAGITLLALSYLTSAAGAVDDTPAVPIVKPDSMGFNPFAKKPEADKSGPAAPEAEGTSTTAAPPPVASADNGLPPIVSAADRRRPPAKVDRSTLPKMESFPPVIEPTVVGGPSIGSRLPARQQQLSSSTNLQNSPVQTDSEHGFGGLIRSALPIPAGATSASLPRIETDSTASNGMAATRPVRPATRVGSLSDQANQAAANLLGGAEIATAFVNPPAGEKTPAEATRIPATDNQGQIDSNKISRFASPATDAPAATVSMASAIQRFPAVTEEQPAASIIQPATGTREEIIPSRPRPTSSAITPEQLALHQEELAPSSSQDNPGSIVEAASFNGTGLQDQNSADFSPSGQIDSSPSDRVVRGAQIDPASPSLTSLQFEPDPIDPQDDFGGAPIQMVPEPGESMVDNAITMDPITDELFSDPFHGGAPCPGGCPPKTYAYAEWVWYQPEMATYQLSSVARTNQEFFRQGFRTTLGFRNDCTNGTELSFMMLENSRQFSDSRAISPTANLTTRFGPSGGLTAANLSSFTGAGVVHRQSHGLEFAQAEFNRVSWGWDVINTFVGIRAMRLNEETLFAAATGAQANNPIQTLPGRFQRQIENILVGPQIGMTLIDDSRFRWTYDLKLKGGAFANLIDSNTSLVDANALVFANNDDTVAFSAMGELSAGAAWHFTENLKIRAGFDAMYIYGLATAREQMNFQPNGTVALTPFTGLTTQKEDDILFWGGTIGIYGNWP